MPSRPTSITIIGWLLMIAGLISVISTTYSVNNPMMRDLLTRNGLPLDVQVSMMYAGAGISVISGLGILSRRVWARTLYTVWGAISYAVVVMTSPQKLSILPGFVLFLLVVFLLYRHTASAWFRASAQGATAETQDGEAPASHE